MSELIDLSGYIEESQPLAESADETQLFTGYTHAERAFEVKKKREEAGYEGENEYVERHMRGVRAGQDEKPINQTLYVSEHGPTHVDSIDHLDPTSDLSIDEMPLEWFRGPAVCLDVSDVTYPDPITPGDIERALEASGLEIREGDIVLLDTGNYRRNYSLEDRERKRQYESKFVGMEGSAGEFLVEGGAKAIGIDAISVDHPPNIFPTYDFPIHSLCAGEEVVIYENLANLDTVAGRRFTFSGLPMKIREGTGSPVRAHAILD
jgi:kynurenine formamidase